MGTHFKIILLLICSQAFLFLMHIVVLRILIKRRVNFSPISVAVKCALFVNMPLLLLTWVLSIGEKMKVYEIINILFYILITYNSLAYFYCHMGIMSETARRIRILYELNLAGRFLCNELVDRYGTKDMLEARLERLRDMNQIAEHNGRFVLKSLLLYRIGILVLNWGFFLKYNKHLKELKKERKA